MARPIDSLDDKFDDTADNFHLTHNAPPALNQNPTLN
jgi:hypothetical protein